VGWEEVEEKGRGTGRWKGAEGRRGSYELIVTVRFPM
jgi:hypothetical protein